MILFNRRKKRKRKKAAARVLKTPTSVPRVFITAIRDYSFRYAFFEQLLIVYYYYYYYCRRPLARAI